MNKKILDDLSYEVLGAAIEVHRELGPGLLENIYQQCLQKELALRKINFEAELQIPLSYKGSDLLTDFRCDFFIENMLVLETKCVIEMHPIHEAQVLSYMKLLKSPKGMLVNFHCSNLFREGQKTFVNQYFKDLPAL